MTFMGCLGCALIGLGPVITLFLFTVSDDPLKVIVVTASGFFWLLSLLLTSLSWRIFSLMFQHMAPSLLVAAISQELMRLAFYYLIRLADNGLRVITISSKTAIGSTSPSSSSNQDVGVSTQESTPNRILNPAIVAYVSGLGFGLMTSIFELLRPLMVARGPGIGFEVWEGKTLHIITAFQVMCTSLMHIFWSVTAFSAFENRDYVLLILIYTSHLGISYASFLNGLRFPWPELVCLSYLLVLIGLAALTWHVLRGKNFTCYRTQTTPVPVTANT